MHNHGAQCSGQLELRAGALAYLSEALQDVGRQETCSYRPEETADLAAAYELMARATERMASAQAELAHPNPNPDPKPDPNPNPDPNPSPSPSPNPHPNPNQAELASREGLALVAPMGDLGREVRRRPQR